MIVLGIDPGSRVTGYGVISFHKNKLSYLGSGCIKTTSSDIPSKIGEIFQDLTAVILEFRPHICAIENVFMGKNPGSALKLGQARGSAIAAAKNQNLDVLEFAPRTIKQHVVGKGSASKEQVKHMVCYLLNIQGKLQIDASDALAISICCAHNIRT